MALILIPETGTGLANANSYADLAAANAYHEGHLYADAWTVATDDRKTAALVMASRVIDANFSFAGYKASRTQAMAWPRLRCWIRGGQFAGQCFDPVTIPQQLVNATAELARQLLVSDTTANSDTQGIQSLGLGQGAISISFNAGDRPGALPDAVLALLSQLGTPASQGPGAMRRVRRIQ